MTDVPVWVEVVNKLATPAIAGVSAAYVYLQYRRSLAWKRNDLAAEIVNRVEGDEELAFACRALDWGTGPLVVPARHRPLLRKSEDSAVVGHDTWSMYVAMRPGLSEETLRDPRGLIYRYCFDKLLSHIDHTHRLLQQGQVRLEDVHGLRYWICKLAKYSYRPTDKAGRKVRGIDVFQPFIAAYGHGGVVALGRKFAIENWSAYEDFRASKWDEQAQLLENLSDNLPATATRAP